MPNPFIPCVFLFLHFWRYFWRNFGLSDLEAFPPDFFEGITHEFLVTLFLVILHPQTPGIALVLIIFRWTHVLDVLALDLRFHKIESVWGLDLLDIACPWGNPTFPKVSLQSVRWIGRSIGWKFEFDPRALFCSCPVLTGLTGAGRRWVFEEIFWLQVGFV